MKNKYLYTKEFNHDWNDGLFELYDKKGNLIYYESKDGSYSKKIYNERNLPIFSEDNFNVYIIKYNDDNTMSYYKKIYKLNEKIIDYIEKEFDDKGNLMNIFNSNNEQKLINLEITDIFDTIFIDEEKNKIIAKIKNLDCIPCIDEIVYFKSINESFKINKIVHIPEENKVNYFMKKRT